MNKRQFRTSALVTCVVAAAIALTVSLRDRGLLLAHATRLNNLPDNRFAVWASDSLVVIYSMQGLGSPQCFDVDSGAITKLPPMAALPAIPFSISTPNWSPDRRHVLRGTLTRVPTYYIYDVLDTRGSVTASLKTYHSQSAWVPDSRKWVAFQEVGHGAHIMVVDAVDSHSKRYNVPNAVGNFLLGCPRNGHLLTADHRKAFYQNPGTLDFFDIELGKPVKIHPFHLKLPAKNLVGPAPYSPATNQIAFSTIKRQEESWLDRTLTRFGITSGAGEIIRYWVSQPDGTGLREIGHHSFNRDANRAYLVSWSPNGKRLLVTCHQRFYVVDVNPPTIRAN